MKYAVFAPGGAEAIDIAIKTARYATKRRKIVSIIKGYHGHSGLSVATGDDRFTKIFLADQPDDFIQVPFNDLDAMEQALQGNDVAALIMETIPATYGFPMPKEGYLKACKALCEKYGTMYIADEVQTGLMRTGEMWGWQAYGVQPDIMVTAKGLSGGLYPICACTGEREGRRLAPRGWRRPYLHLGRRRARLRRRPQGDRDAAAAGTHRQCADGDGLHGRRACAR